MSTYRSYRTYAAIQAKAQREAMRRQKEIERQRKEQAKRDHLEQAKLEVAESENHIDLLLSLHKDCAPEVNWRAFAAALCPSEPPILATSARRAWRSGRVSAPLETQPDEPAILCQGLDHPERVGFAEAMRQWKENRGLAERVLAGNEAAWVEALAAFSTLDEVAHFGAGIDVTVYPEARLECEVRCNDAGVVPLTTKTLTTTGKVSEKPIPASRRQEIYQDHVCSGLLRVAREVFAILPVELLLIHGHATVRDSATGTDSARAIYSVFIPRRDLATLNFDKLDPSDAIERFSHRGDFKSSRKSGAFEAIEPLRFEEHAGDDRHLASLESLRRQVGALRAELAAAFEKDSETSPL